MNKLKKWCMLGCFLALCLILTSMITRYTAVKAASKLMSVNNIVVKSILPYLPLPEQREETKKIDWSSLYPFGNTDETPAVQRDSDRSSATNKAAKIISKINSKKGSFEERASKWILKNIAGYQEFVELYNRYNNTINWNIISKKEYNGVVELENGQLTVFKNKDNVSEKIKNLSELANFSEKNGAAFFYLSAPSKISRHDKTYDSLDFSNANTDELLEGLRKNGVDYIDFRDNIDEEGLTADNVFFRTDHHWTPESGLWATRILAKYLNDNGMIQSDLSLLDAEKWDRDIYKNYFLGSRGKKTTLARTTPDDITIYHPKFDTRLHLEIPNKNIAADGNFDITYDMKRLEKVDYYNENPYAAYSWSDRPYTYIRNDDAINDTTILLIKNSFGNVVLPFLSLQAKNIFAIDPRVFTGSIHEFIKQKKPDIVIVLYSANYFNGIIDYTEHNDPWDFR